MCGWSARVCLALGNHLLLFRPGSSKVILLGQRVQTMQGPAMLSGRCLLLTYPLGGELYYPDLDASVPFAQGVPFPVGHFIGDGMLAVASEVGLEVYAEEASRLTLKAELRESRAQPLAVLPTSRAGRFTVLSRGGLVEWYEV
jgi:hypothetical protein